MSQTSNKLRRVALGILIACTLGMTTLSVTAGDAVVAPATSGRVGLGQLSDKEPAKVNHLGLSDPLVQKKYVQSPDLMRFLRATYSEACARGILVKSLSQVRFERSVPPEVKAAIASLQDGKRLWKMTSFEMEVAFREGYLQASYYCDCLMKEVSDADMVDPRKSLEVMDQIPKSRQTTCDRLSKEQAAETMKKVATKTANPAENQP